MADFRIRGDRLKATAGADHRRDEHPEGRRQAQGRGQVVAIGQARHQGSHRVQRLERQQAAVEDRDLGEHRATLRA